MNTYFKILVLIVVGCFAVPSIAAVTSGETTVDTVFIGGGTNIYVAFIESVNDNCSNTVWKILTSTQSQWEEILAVAMSAEASGHSVVYTVTGCVSGYPKLTSISITSP